MRTKLAPLGLALVLACAGLQAHAIGRLADVTVVDRNTGATLPLYYSQGEYWVPGTPGARYAISVRNQLGERVMAVTSVDGVNVLSGATAAWGQTGYVFGAYANYQITGWRKSSSEVAAFEFSAASDSYAERTGRPNQVGVIGVALFRERLPEPVAQPWSPPLYRQERDSKESRSDTSNAPPAPAPAPTTAAPAAPAAAEQSSMARGRLADALAQSNAAAPTAKLGTAHGQREGSYVEHTNFERQQSQPNEIIRIRYDSRENLIALGVIRAPATHTPNPFPHSDTASYVPDPPARRY
jgi:pyruvate/2-oxoglutarate dehydrogenase complex dihydrolipoamide acyltransferase (E2) component